MWESDNKFLDTWDIVFGTIEVQTGEKIVFYNGVHCKGSLFYYENNQWKKKENILFTRWIEQPWMKIFTS